MSEDKAIAALNTIFTRVYRDFPLIASVPNIAKRIARNLREKIADVARFECSGRSSPRRGEDRG